MSASELEALRRELQAEEEVNEILALKAELAELKKSAIVPPKEVSNNKKKATPVVVSKKKASMKEEEGEEPLKKKQKTASVAKSLVSKFPITTASEIVPPSNRFEILGVEKPQKKKQHAQKETPFLQEWAPLVKATAAVPRFLENAKALLKESHSWKRARKCGDWCKDLPHCYALDCEMCVCEEPGTKKRTNRELVRVSVVDGSDRELSLEAARTASSADVLLDTLVKPGLPVVDYVTRIHGVDESALENVTFERSHAQAALNLLVCSRCVLVGHALHNDLAALQFHHDLVVDTSALFTLTAKQDEETPNPGTPALRDVAEAVVPAAAYADMVKRAHDSTVDARTALLSAYFLLDNNNTTFAVPRAQHRPDPVHKKFQLFVHRIPPEFEADAVKLAMERSGAVFVDACLNFHQGQPYSKLTLVFRSEAHADLAFASLGDKFDDDKTGRPQKKLFLTASSVINASLFPADATTNNFSINKHGPYCKVRKF